MNVVKEIQRVNAREIAAHRGGFHEASSWHAQYKDSAYIFIGGFPYELSEGDLICIFSQYGEVVDINLVRDKETGKSKGFAFLGYEDQRSTILAVDNLNGIKVMNRTIRVDHCAQYKRPKKTDGEDNSKISGEGDRPIYNAAPKPLESESDEDSWEDEDYGLNPEDPMYGHLLKKAKKARRKLKKKERKEAKKDLGTMEGRNK